MINHQMEATMNLTSKQIGQVQEIIEKIKENKVISPKDMVEPLEDLCCYLQRVEDLAPSTVLYGFAHGFRETIKLALDTFNTPDMPHVPTSILDELINCIRAFNDGMMEIFLVMMHYDPTMASEMGPIQ